MKKYLIMAFAVAMAISSCKEEDLCENFLCQNGGLAVEVNGSCECKCADFYTGTNCETRQTEKFIGLYNGIITCDGSPSTSYVQFIEDALHANKLLLSLEGQTQIYALIQNNANSFNVPAQALGFGNTSVSGNGNLNGLQILMNINYTPLQGTSTAYNCSFTGSK